MKRAGYYRANTGNDWNDMKQYDLVLDSSRLGIEGCVKVLKGLFESVNSEKRESYECFGNDGTNCRKKALKDEALRKELLSTRKDPHPLEAFCRNMQRVGI